MMKTLIEHDGRPTHVPVPCVEAPQRFTGDRPDPSARIACRTCPIRPYCARDAWETPNVTGLWAGVVVPGAEDDARGHDFALKQLKGLAELGGLTVRPATRTHRRAQWQRMDNVARRDAS